MSKYERKLNIGNYHEKRSLSWIPSLIFTLVLVGTYTFSKNYGTLTSIVKNGKEQLSERIKLTVMRAPTDNERNIKNKCKTVL